MKKPVKLKKEAKKIKTKLKETVSGYTVEFTIGVRSFKTMHFGLEEKAVEYEKELKEAFKNLTNAL